MLEKCHQWAKKEIMVLLSNIYGAEYIILSYIMNTFGQNHLANYFSSSGPFAI